MAHPISPSLWILEKSFLVSVLCMTLSSACSPRDDHDGADGGTSLDATAGRDGGDGDVPIVDGATACEGERFICGDECVDLDTHRDHCGDCNNACDPGLVCDTGQCIVGVTSLVISELCALEPGYFEIYNGTLSPVDLAGYQVQWETDGQTNGSHVLPSYSLAPQSFVVLREGSGESVEGVLTLGASISWATGVGVRLINPQGAGVDFVRTGNATTTPPTGTTWNGSNADNPGATVDQSLARDIFVPDTDSAVDWKLTVRSSPGSFCAGLVQCGAACVDVQVDYQHCGACGYVCGGAQVCHQGRCQPAMGSLWISEYRLYGRAGVEIHNGTSSAVDLTGYRIDLTGDESFSYTFSSHVLAPGAYAFVYMGAGLDVGNTFYAGPSVAFGPNVAIALFDSSGQPLDFLRLGNSDIPPPTGTSWFGDNVHTGPETWWVRGDQSYRRNTDTLDTDSSADWAWAMPSTPGFACRPGLELCGGSCVSLETRSDHCGACDTVCEGHESCVQGVCSSVGAVVISEVNKDTPLAIELYNGTAVAVDLEGWQLRWDADGGSDTYTLAPGTTLQPGGFIRLLSLFCESAPGYICLGAADAIAWSSHIAVTLHDASDVAVDFVRTGASSVQPPMGITWNGPNPPEPEMSWGAFALHRRIYQPNSHSAADWFLGDWTNDRYCWLLPHAGCDGECVDLLHDANHCGECGNACGAGGICHEGYCVRQGDLALTQSNHSGQMRVFYDHRWRAVGGTQFNNGEAEVACLQLGFTSGTPAGTYGDDPQGLYALHCTGTEPRLLDCSYSLAPVSGSAGVLCGP